MVEAGDDKVGAVNGVCEVWAVEALESGLRSEVGAVTAVLGVELFAFVENEGVDTRFEVDIQRGVVVNEEVLLGRAVLTCRVEVARVLVVGEGQ